MKRPASFLRPKIRCVHESHSLLAILPARRSRARRRARSRRRTGPGRDRDQVAGVIESVGAGVGDLKVGDRVVASCGHNGAREKIALPANSIVKIPDNLDFDRAAGIIITYGTALHALEDRASPKPGETLVVLGAAGGTGLAACELGKLMGLKVIACASSDEKLEFAKQHGADIIFDPVGGSYAEAALRAIAWEGRFLVIGFAAGDIPKMPLNLALLKGCDIRGVFW